MVSLPDIAIKPSLPNVPDSPLRTVTVLITPTITHCSLATVIGLGVRVRLEQAQASDAITLPQQAVTRSEKGDVVMVVSPEGKVSPRPVKVAAGKGNQWVILDGLKAGEQVMVDGFQKLRGNAPVKPVPWKSTPEATPTPGTPGTTGTKP